MTDLDNRVVGYWYTISTVYTVAKVASLHTSVLHAGGVIWGTPTVDLTHLPLLTWIGAAWLMNGL